jgi:hypothetical protein
MLLDQEISSSFNLTSLVEFNPALVYGFGPELSLNTVEYLLQSANQYQDMFNAYKYAQDEILPAIRNEGLENITTEKILHWLDKIHSYAAATLANDAANAGLKDIAAGQPTKSQLLRWHHKNEFKGLITSYLSKSIPLTSVEAYAREKNINENDLKKLLDFLEKIRDDQTIKAQENETHTQINSVYQLGSFTLDKVANLYHTNQLSSDEKLLVAKFVKIYPAPASLPEKRQQFAKEFLAELKKCQPNNIDQVAYFITSSFYRITDNHWYFKGNERAATCFINTFLRALGQPSILICCPDERNDPGSSYSQAIANIDNNITLLQNHLKERILDASKGKKPQNEEISQIVTLNVKLSKVITSIKQKFPDNNIINDDFYKLWEQKAQYIRPDQPQEIIKYLEISIMSFISIYDQLEMIKKYNLKDNSKNSFAQGLRRATAANETQDMLYFCAHCDINQQDTKDYAQEMYQGEIIELLQDPETKQLVLRVNSYSENIKQLRNSIIDETQTIETKNFSAFKLPALFKSLQDEKAHFPQSPIQAENLKNRATIYQQTAEEWQQFKFKHYARKVLAGVSALLLFPITLLTLFWTIPWIKRKQHQSFVYVELPQIDWDKMKTLRARLKTDNNIRTTQNADQTSQLFNNQGEFKKHAIQKNQKVKIFKEKFGRNLTIVRNAVMMRFSAV